MTTTTTKTANTLEIGDVVVGQVIGNRVWPGKAVACIREAEDGVSFVIRYDDHSMTLSRALTQFRVRSI